MTTQRGYAVNIQFAAPLQEMAESEIMAMIASPKLQAMRAREQHPLVKAFVVGHEGESKGNVVGVGNVVKRWFKATIRALGQKIRSGLQLFHGHAVGTNDHEGRVQIGEVVGSAVKEIDGRESVVVACHVFQQFRHLPLDVASVEVEAQFAPSGDGSIDIVGLGDVTGIALSNSQIDKPGFPGATLLGQLQAFEKRSNTADKPKLVRGFGNNKGQLKLA